MKREVTTSADPLTRVHALMEAFHLAPPNADIEFRVGRRAVCMSVNGKDYAVSSDEARQLADIVHEACTKIPPDAQDDTDFELLESSLRLCARKADEQ